MRLKDAARKLTPFAHHQTSSVPITNAITAGNYTEYIQKLDEHVGEAYELCSLIEICLMNGIRIKEFQGIIPFWGLLERLVATQNESGLDKNVTKYNQNITFHSSVEDIALMVSLRTPLAKSRGWIRHALNLRALDDCMQIILKDERLLHLFYTPDAILSHKDNIIVFMAVVRTLKVLPFAFTVEDLSLNLNPSWTTALVSAGGYRPIISKSVYSDSPPILGKSGHSVSKIQQKPTKSYFSSFLSSIERGINDVMESVRNDDKNNFYSINNNHNNNENGNRYGNRNGLGLNFISESGVLGQGWERDREQVPLFGTPLRDLILNEKRCGVCNIDPQLGIPSMIIAMINFLTENIATPGLFKTSINIKKYYKLRNDFENERGVPNIISKNIVNNDCSSSNNNNNNNNSGNNNNNNSGNSNNNNNNSNNDNNEEYIEMIHLVAYSLLSWLSELPEPLLGTTHYSAIEACLDVDQEDARIRNLSLLILEAPWYSQSLLSKLFTFLSLLLDKNNTSNGLNIISITSLFTPFLFRRIPYLQIQVHTKDYPRVWGSFYSSLAYDLNCVERDNEAMGLLVAAATGD